MQLPDEAPLVMFTWYIGRGAMHMRLTSSPGFDSAEMTALTKFWEETVSLDVTPENASKLLEMAKAVPGFPPDKLEAAEKQLARLSSEDDQAST